MTEDDDIDLDALEKELEAAGPEDSDTKKPIKKLTPAEWAEVKTHWELGDKTLSELSRVYGIRIDSIHKRLKKEGVVRGSRAAEVSVAVVDEAQEAAQINARRIRETKENHYNYADAIAKLVMNSIVQAQRTSQRFGMIDADIAALGKAAKALEIIRKERYSLLGLDKEDGDPDEIDELLVSELTSEQIEQVRQSLRGQATDEMFDFDTSELVDLSGIDNLDDEDDGIEES